MWQNPERKGWARKEKSQGAKYVIAKDIREREKRMAKILMDFNPNQYSITDQPDRFSQLTR